MRSETPRKRCCHRTETPKRPSRANNNNLCREKGSFRHLCKIFLSLRVTFLQAGILLKLGINEKKTALLL